LDSKEDFLVLCIFKITHKPFGNKYNCYTNSTLLRSEQEIDLFSAIDHQKDLQPIYTGGTVFHVFLGHEIVDLKALKNLIIKIFTETNLPTITVTPTFSICKNHGYISGEQPICDICDEATEVYSRIVGYLRPVSRWNHGKKAEFVFRNLYDKNVEDIETHD